ncbi:MAG: COG4223 family protein [Pseudolabrys sp.]
MADKPTAPETAEGARRRKRPTPTIDLKATEVKSATTGQTPPPPPEPPRAASEAASAGPDPETARRAEPPVSKNAGFSWPLAASGVVGGAVVALALAVLWLAGALPSRDNEMTALRARVALLETQLRNAPAAPDSKALDDLSQRLAKIETAITKLPAGDAAMADRLAATENAMKSLGIALAALNRRADDVAGNAAAARDHADAAANAVAKLQATVQNAPPATDRGEIDALNKRIASLEQTIKTKTNSDTAARLALSAASLRDAVARGEPFAAQLAEVKSLGGDVNVLAPLEPFASSGLPKQADLARELSALIPAMLKASGADATNSGFFARLQANAGNLVRIRPVDAPPGDDPADVVARIEVKAARNDVTGAAVEISRLPAKARVPADAWMKKAQARQAALDAAQKLAADSSRALSR